MGAGKEAESSDYRAPRRAERGEGLAGVNH